MDSALSGVSKDDLNWLVMRGFTVIIKPINLDPTDGTPINMLVRLEKNHKLVVQVSNPSINIALNESARFVRKSRGT